MLKKLLIGGGIVVALVVLYFVYKKYVGDAPDQEKSGETTIPQDLPNRERQIIDRLRNRYDFKDIIRRACEKYPDKCQELKNRNQS